MCTVSLHRSIFSTMAHSRFRFCFSFRIYIYIYYFPLKRSASTVHMWLCKCVWVFISRSCTWKRALLFKFLFFVNENMWGWNFFRQQNNTRSLADADVLYKFRCWFWLNRCACVVDKYHRGATTMHACIDAVIVYNNYPVVHKRFREYEWIMKFSLCLTLNSRCSRKKKTSCDWCVPCFDAD